jgi:predicted nucleic acid-binding protein
MREFLACTTRSGMMLEPLDRMEALDHVQGFIEQFEILTDSATTADRLYQLLREVDRCGKQVHDANIVATMLDADVTTLLTANVKDFRRFESYISVLSLPTVSES